MYINNTIIDLMRLNEYEKHEDENGYYRQYGVARNPTSIRPTVIDRVHVCVYNITVISFREECTNLYSLLAATQKQQPIIQLGHSWPLPILAILFRTYDCVAHIYMLKLFGFPLYWRRVYLINVCLLLSLGRYLCCWTISHRWYH